MYSGGINYIYLINVLKEIIVSAAVLFKNSKKLLIIIIIDDISYIVQA